MGKPDKNAMDRAIHGQDLMQVLAISSAALARADDESLSKWLIKALIFAPPITDWQEVQFKSEKVKPIVIHPFLLPGIVSIFAVVVSLFAWWNKRLVLSKEYVSAALIATIIAVCFAGLGIVAAGSGWQKISGRKKPFPFWKPLVVLAVVFALPPLLGFSAFSRYIFYLYEFIAFLGIILWILGVGWSLVRKIKGKYKKDAKGSGSVSPITEELQRQNESESCSRGWWTDQQLLENRPGAPDDPDTSWIVISSSPDFTFSPFATENDAIAFARCRVRDSIEQLRRPNQDFDTLYQQWFAYGESCAVVGSDYSILQEIDGFIEYISNDGERDWQVLKDKQGVLSFLEEKSRDEPNRNFEPFPLARNCHPDLPVDLSCGIQLKKTNVFIPWECSRKTLEQLLGKYGLKKMGHNSFVMTIKIGGVEEELTICFAFGKGRGGGGYEHRLFSQLKIRGKQTGDFVKDFWACHQIMEVLLGKPDCIDPPDPDVYDLPGFRWDKRHARIEHTVMERFGPEEHQDFDKTYETRDDALIMETVNHVFTDASLSDDPVCTLITGVPNAKGGQNYPYQKQLSIHPCLA